VSLTFPNVSKRYGVGDIGKYRRGAIFAPSSEVNKKQKSYGLSIDWIRLLNQKLEVFLVDDVLGKGTALGRASKF
jgi:hypothetical protein